jgi:hypothetical protein
MSLKDTLRGALLHGDEQAAAALATRLASVAGPADVAEFTRVYHTKAAQNPDLMASEADFAELKRVDRELADQYPEASYDERLTESFRRVRNGGFRPNSYEQDHIDAIAEMRGSRHKEQQ